MFSLFTHRWLRVGFSSSVTTEDRSGGERKHRQHPRFPLGWWVLEPGPCGPRFLFAFSTNTPDCL